MEYETFVNQFIEELKLNMEQSDVELQRQTIAKNNGVMMDSIAIPCPDAPMAFIVYPEDYFGMVKDGYSISGIAENVARDLEKQRLSIPEPPRLTQESARQNLYCAVVNSADNEEMLMHMPHEKLEDLSVIAKFRVGAVGSFLVTDDICQSLRMTSEEVLEMAHMNSDRQGYQCQTMGEVMRDLSTREGMPEDYADELIQSGERCPMWILSNEQRIDGAAAITSEEALKAAHEKIGEDFYVLPSSRHEVILIPQSFVPDVGSLQAMVRDINATEVSKTDKLSDGVYKCNGKCLLLANAASEKISKSSTKGLSKEHARSH